MTVPALRTCGEPADNAYTDASAAANTAAQRRAMDVIVAKDGKLMLPHRFNERLPGAAAGAVDCTSFPRPAKLAPDAAGQVPMRWRRSCAWSCRRRQTFQKERMRSGCGVYPDFHGRLRPERSAGLRWPSPTRTGKRRSATCGATVASRRSG